MSWLMRMKALVVLTALMIGASDYILQAGQGRPPKTTLAAAGEAARKAGIATYRLHRPAPDPENTRVHVELLDASQALIGSYTETRSASGDRQTTEIVLRERRLSMVVTGGEVVLSVDGAELYRGPFAAAPEPVGARIQAERPLFELMGAIGRDVATARRDAGKLSAEWRRVSFVPAVARRPALALARWLPAGTPLYASAQEKGITCTGEMECNNAVGITRSVACSNAKDDASEECSDWVLCIGCCSWLAEDCDCTCASGDLACWCIACGGTCEAALN